MIVTKSVNLKSSSQVFNLLEITPMQTQDKSEGTQDNHTEQVEWPKQTTSCILFLKTYNAYKVDVRKRELTELSKSNIHVVWCLSMQTTTTTKFQTRCKVCESN